MWQIKYMAFLILSRHVIIVVIVTVLFFEARLLYVALPILGLTL